MSGFRKCGIYPLNPGQISDRQLAPSHAFVKLKSDLKPVSKLNDFTPEQEKLYQKHYEEGYNLNDPKYSQWLKAQNCRLLIIVTRFQFQSLHKSLQHHLLFLLVQQIQSKQV